MQVETTLLENGGEESCPWVPFGRYRHPLENRHAPLSRSQYPDAQTLMEQSFAVAAVADADADDAHVAADGDGQMDCNSGTEEFDG